MTRYKIFGLMCLLFVAMSGHLSAATPKNDTQYFNQNLAPQIEEIMAAQKITGLSIAIVHGNDLVYADGFGFANIEKNVPATPDTVFGVGSVSKVFTATAVMQLVEQGLIDLNTPVEHYLPKFHLRPPLNLPSGHHDDGNFPPITPFNLLIHYAGMPRQAPERPQQLIWVPEDLPELMHDLYTRSRLIYPPNFRYSYSNPGIAVLGRIIEVVVDDDFSSAIERQLLHPLEMFSSSFSNRGFSRTITDKLAQGYASRNRPVNRPPIRGVPAGNLHSTVLDVANFMKMYLNHGTYKNQKILNSTTIDKMLTIQNSELRQNDPDHTGPDQGLVWVLNNQDIPGNPKVARHNGKVVGFSSVLVLLPEEQIGVVVLTNIRNKKIKPIEVARAALDVARARY